VKTEGLVPVAEYLRTSYHPDCDYVDGEVLERNWGERDHSASQRELILFFGIRGKTWRVFVFPGQRVKVSPTRFRVPDICVFVGQEPEEQIFRTPPFISIEILPPEDRWTRIQQKIDDYLRFGVAVCVCTRPQRTAGSGLYEGRQHGNSGRRPAYGESVAGRASRGDFRGSRAHVARRGGPIGNRPQDDILPYFCFRL
jgi:Uma2 family endonuclease